MKTKIVYLALILTLVFSLAVAIVPMNPAAAQNTPQGDNVSVYLEGWTPWGMQDITVTFEHVDVAGITDAHCVSAAWLGEDMILGEVKTGVRFSSNDECHDWLTKDSTGIRCYTQSCYGTFTTHMGHLFGWTPLDLLKYPVIVGDSWTYGATTIDGGYYIPLAEVESISDTVVVPAGTFNSCVRTLRTYSYYSYTPYDSDIESIQLWFAPGIGPVKAIATQFDDTTVTGELNSYSLSSPSPGDYFPMSLGDSWEFHWDSSPEYETYEITLAWRCDNIPSNLVSGGYDIWTSAEYQGQVTIEMDYDIPWFIPNAQEEDFKLFQWDGLGWQDVTDFVDTSGNVINGTVSGSLSTFFVGSTDFTPVGSLIEVDLDGFFTVNFDTISIAGYTGWAAYNTSQLAWPPMPLGYEILEDVLIEIRTTADYSGTITGESNYGTVESEWINENAIRVLQWTGTEWNDVTTSVDPINNIITMESSILGPILLGEPTVNTATGTGPASFSPSSGTIENLTAVPEGSLPTADKPSLQFPHGFFSFDITGLSIGEIVVVTIELPSAVPVGTQYWKYHASEDGWVQIPMGSDNGDNVITITLVNGGVGDDDGDPNNDTIVDQGGPGNPGGAAGVPVFPSLYIGIAAALGAGVLAYLLRRRVIHQE